MAGLDLSLLGVLVLVVSAVVSFAVGRVVSARWRAKRRARQDEVARAAESRQVRRARERAGR